MKELISVKELSEELGVSKPTLFKRIDKLNLRSKLQKQGRALMIPYEVAEELRRAYSVSDDSSEKAEKTNSTNENEDITSSLVELLRDELKSKNQLIENLQRQIEGLQEDNRRYMTMNTQLLLSSGSNAPVDPVEAEFTETSEDTKEEKKSLLRRLFGI